MSDFGHPERLRAPRLSELRLQQLFDVTADRDCRVVLARFLDDPWQLQGSAEYYAHDLDVPLDLVDVPHCLVALRHGGWLHQRPAGYGLASRLRRDDLELRFPDTMRALRLAPELAGERPRDPGGIEAQLRRFSR